MEKRAQRAARVAVALCLTFLPGLPTVGSSSAHPRQNSQAGVPLKYVVPAKYKRTVTAFEERVKAYVKLREQLEEKTPKVSKDATPEQIEAYQKAFEEVVRAARAGAKQGDVFTPDAAQYVRLTIRQEFKGKDRQELRKTILEADTKGVPLRVNYPYPDNKELTEMPPTLLLKLPQLPKQVKYRFVGHNLLLVDRENTLIVDYMPNALP